MFNGCSSLNYLGLSDFKTDALEYTSYAFAYCTNLTSLDLSEFYTEECEEYEGIFEGLNNITILINKDRCSNVIEEYKDSQNIEFIYVDDILNIYFYMNQHLI